MSERFSEEWIQKQKAAIAAAVAQLYQSERGRQALYDFRKMLRNGATSLDDKNMTALCFLLESVSTFPGSVLEALSNKLDQQHAEQMATDTASINVRELC
jgi:hypothetical protein